MCSVSNITEDRDTVTTTRAILGRERGVAPLLEPAAPVKGEVGDVEGKVITPYL